MAAKEDEPAASLRLLLLTTATTLGSACRGPSAAPPAMVPSEENQLVPKEVRRGERGPGDTRRGGGGPAAAGGAGAGGGQARPGRLRAGRGGVARRASL